MSLYALIRNAYDPRTKCYHLSESDIELEGHLDGNLCRCTGYKPILKAAKTFITEDLKGQLILDSISTHDNFLQDEDQKDILYRSEMSKSGSKIFSCGRPGGCCRDTSIPAAGLGVTSSPDLSPSDESGGSLKSDMTSSLSSVESLESEVKAPAVGASYGKPMKSREEANIGEQVEGSKKTSVSLDAPISNNAQKVPTYDFKFYSPQTELLFPPALRKYIPELVFYGDSRRLWLRPVTLKQLLDIKNAYPSAKLVSGSSEIQVEVRLKNMSYAVSVYVSDICELRSIEIPDDDAVLATMSDLVIGANASLTDIEDACRIIYSKLGRRAQVLEAARKQLRYFAGRQIRNVASLAGNIATASPISDMNPVLLAAGATLTCKSITRGEFVLLLSSFFIGYRKTSLPPDAVITHIRIPLATPDALQVTKAYKQAKRKDDDIAIVTACFCVRLNAAGHVDSVHLWYGGMAQKTVEAAGTVDFLLGKKWYDATTLDVAMTCLERDFALHYGVIGGMATYRRTLALSLFFRFWHEVVSDLELGDVDSELIREVHRGISSGSRDDFNPFEQRVVGKQIPHLSSLKQTTGEAEYVDDIPRQDRELFGALVLSSKAHAKIISVDWSPAIGPRLALGYVDKNDISKEANLWGSIVKDEPFFADGEVFSHGQPIGLVYAETALKAQAAARAVRVEYEDLPVILTIDEAIAADSFFAYGKELKKGAAVDGKMLEIWATCDKIFEGTSRIGGQEHFYLETNTSLVIPSREDGTMEVWSSTQNTMEVQEFVSQVTGVPSNRINVRVKRMGGAFGGKESRSVQLAAILAVAAKKTKRPMRAMLNRDEDMTTTGQRKFCNVRHYFITKFGSQDYQAIPFKLDGR
jgi:xanthine dehydrogenase/oxidase